MDFSDFLHTNEGRIFKKNVMQAFAKNRDDFEKLKGEKNICNSKELVKYFNEIIENLKFSPIVKIFSDYNSCPRNSNDVFHSIDDTITILFSNHKALIIDYNNIDNLCVEYKEMSKDEIEKIVSKSCEDLFNRADEIYNPNTYRMTCRFNSMFEYDVLEKIEFKCINENYGIWDNNEIIEKTPTENTFGEIILILKNGNEIHICPEDAIMDGYMDVWCKGAIVNSKEYRLRKD